MISLYKILTCLGVNGQLDIKHCILMPNRGTVWHWQEPTNATVSPGRRWRVGVWRGDGGTGKESRMKGVCTLRQVYRQIVLKCQRHLQKWSPMMSVIWQRSHPLSETIISLIRTWKILDCYLLKVAERFGSSIWKQHELSTIIPPCTTSYPGL